MKRFLFSTCLVSSFLLAVPALADDTPTIVISPTRSATDLNKIASSVTVIGRQQLEQKNHGSVGDVLREVPGISVAGNGTPGQPTRIFVRGTNSNHVLVLLDGVVINDPSDPSTALDMSNMTTDNIERIEVLRGNQSALYGSQAIGGVISLFSKKGSGAPTTTGFAEYGRYDSSKVGLGNSGQIGKTSYSLSASKSHTDGLSALGKPYGGFEKDSSDIFTLSGNLVSALTDILKVKLNARYNRNVSEFDSPGSFIRPADDTQPENDSRQFSGRAAAELSLFEGRWVQEVGWSTLNVNRTQTTVYYDTFFNELFGRQQYIGWRDTKDWVHHVQVSESNKLTFGFEQAIDHYKTDTVREINVGNTALFANDQIDFTDALYTSIGVRLDNHQTFGREFTWKVSPGYNIESTGTRLKASYGTGYKAPSLSQLYDPVSGNRTLNPEKSKGWDIGFEQAFWDGKVTTGSTYFRNDITNLIGFDPAPPFGTINVGKARSEGFENSLSVSPLPELSLQFSHVYTLANDRRTNKELARRPRHQFNMDALYNYSDEGDVGLNVRYASSRRDFDVVSFAANYVKPATVVDLSTNYDLNDNATLYGRLENVLNKEYEEVSGFTQPGMGLYVGVKAHY